VHSAGPCFLPSLTLVCGVLNHSSVTAVKTSLSVKSTGTLSTVHGDYFYCYHLCPPHFKSQKNYGRMRTQWLSMPLGYHIHYYDGMLCTNCVRKIRMKITWTFLPSVDALFMNIDED